MTQSGRTNTPGRLAQMTLGELVHRLERVQDPLKQVVFDFGDVPAGETQMFDCYAGRQRELALRHRRPHDPRMTSAATIAERAREALGCTFIGPTGREHRMDGDTPLWAANWGQRTGNAVVGLEETSEGVIIRTWKME